MSKELCISSTPHETRLAIVEDDQLTEIYYERENEYTLAGSIYKGRVTRVLPGMQSAFVDIGLERDAFLYVTDFLEEQGEAADFEGGAASAPAPASGRVREPRDGGSREGRGHRPQREPGTGASGGPALAGADEEAEPEAGTPGASESAEPQGFDAGTRRWRGRRGRRRGGLRGSSPESPFPAVPVFAEPTAQTSLHPAFNDEDDTEPAALFGIEVVPTERAGGGIPISAATQSPLEGESFISRSGREGTRRDGRRDGRGSGRNEGRGDSRRDPRADFRGEDRSPVLPAPAGQPIVLPGESLSKYGQKPAPIAIQIEAVDRSQEKPLPAYTTFRPSTLVEDVPVWDGVSAALPGESLSKHRKREVAAPPAQTASEQSATSFFEGGRHREEAPHAPAAADGSAEVHRHQDDASAGHAGPIEVLHAVNTPDAVTFEAVPGEAAHVPPVGDPAQQEVLAHAAPAIVPVPLVIEEEAAEKKEEAEAAEFEPEHASASYRVDPAAPSEFRLSSTLEGPEQEQEAAPAAQTEITPAVASPVDAEPTGIFADADEAKWDWQERDVEPVASHEDLHLQGSFDTGAEKAPGLTSSFEHGISEIAPSASSHSEAGHPGLSGHAAEGPDGAGIVEYESGNGDFEDGPVEQMHAFAPGAGLLEEEEIDEEEYDFSPLHAHADDHDLEEIEEETLDSQIVGSQLGDFVRDEHIKRRVQGESDPDSPEDELEESEESDFEEEIGAGFAESEFEGEEAEEELSGEEGSRSTRLAEPGTEGHADGGAHPTPRRNDGRRDGRRGGRGDNGRGGRRANGQRGRNGHRPSAQMTDLPIISDLLKQGQEVLVQIAKEPIAKKGARITSHIALPGRFLVFMPTVNHVGVSRKISSDEERHRLKRILVSEKGTAPGGFIVRTAADGASEEELRADLRFLISLWTEIKTRSDNGKAPALIYHDLNLVERVLRDQVSDNFSTIWVDSETEYERIVRFLNRFEPSLVRRVKLYTKETPLFEQFGIQDEISKALKSKVWLKSGGSIVINQTEALVAIDINTGKYVGKTARLEDTIVKTNLDAIPEIVRQIRLRDLGGIIIIDFIDMDERKNRHRVMAALEEELKNDRAPSKVLQFNDFGLVAITRKRVKQSLERTLSTQCMICAGTGMVKSPVTVCNEIYTELRKMMKQFERGDVLLRVNPEIVKALKANNGKWLGELEEMIGRTILVKSDPALHPEQFDIH